MTDAVKKAHDKAHDGTVEHVRARDRGMSFRAQLALIISLLVLASGVTVAVVSFAGSARAARTLSDSLFREASRHAVARARNHVLGVAPLLTALARLAPNTLALADSDRLALQLADVLRANEGLTWLSFSDASGAFTAAYRTADGTIRLNQSRIIEGNTRLVERDLLPDNNTRPHRTDDDNGYDPRTRAFYRRAKETGRLVWLPPYVFYGANVPGITAAIPVTNSTSGFAGVMTADFDLDALSAFFATLAVSEHSRFFLFTDDGVVLAHPGIDVATATTQPVDAKLLELSDVRDPLTKAYRANLPAGATTRQGAGSTREGERFQSFRFQQNGEEYLASATAFRVDEGITWLVGALAPEDDFLAAARRGQRMAIAAAFVAVLAALFVAALVSRRVSRPIVNLVGFMRRVGDGDLESRAELSGPREFRALSSSLNRMIDDLRDRLRMRHALNIAMEVQQQLLPSSPPTVKGLDVAGHSTYCDETGGDYYDFIAVDSAESGALLIVLGDVMGHGVASALVMSAVRAVLRDRCAETGTLAALLGRLNALIHADLGGQRFMTMYLGLIDPHTRTLRWASAGHDPAIVYDPQRDAFEEVDESGFPLGVVDGDDGYREITTGPLNVGQIVFIGTDGIWEMENPAGEQFGKDRLRALLRESANTPGAEISRRLLETLETFRAGGERKDDVTFVVFKIVATE